MPSIARLGDGFVGKCSGHLTTIQVTGTIVAGSGDTKVNGLGAARLGDAVVASCGHAASVISGSSNIKVNGRAVARLGDVVVGPTICGTIIAGSPNVRGNG